MEAIERERRMRLCRSEDDWNQLYLEIFGSEPDWGDDDWGQYRIERLMDAIFYKRPIKAKPLAESIVL